MVQNRNRWKNRCLSFLGIAAVVATSFSPLNSDTFFSNQFEIKTEASPFVCPDVRADIWFANDESGSVDSSEFNDALDFMYQISDGFPYDAVTGLQAGAYAWDTGVNNVIIPITENFADSDDSGLIQDGNVVIDSDGMGIRELYPGKQGGGGTLLDQATQHMADLINGGNGKRASVPQVAVILTDASEGQLTGTGGGIPWINAADNVRAAGAEVIVVVIAEAATAYGSGSGPAATTIDAVAGANGLVVDVPTYSDAADPAQNYVTQVVNSICQIGQFDGKVALEKVATFNDDITANGLAEPGETITYDYTARNTGITDLVDLVLTEDPSSFSGTNSLPAPMYVGGDEDVDGESDDPDLANGSSGSITWTANYILSQDDINTGFVSNQAFVNADDGLGNIVIDFSDDPNDPTTGNDPTITTLPVNDQLSLLKLGMFVDSNSNSNTEVGEIINYTFTVENTGNTTLTNITVSDDLPNISISGGPIPILNPGEIDNSTFTASYAVTQNDIDNGYVQNSATVSGSDPQNNIVEDISDAGNELIETPDGLGNTNGDATDDPTVTTLFAGNTTKAYNDINQTPQGVSVIGNVLTNDTDPDGDTQVVQFATGKDSMGAAITIPSDGTATSIYTDSGSLAGSIELLGDGSYTFTPDSNFAGEVSIEYQIEDSNVAPATSTAALSITVTPTDNPAANDSPSAINDGNTTEEDISVSGDLLINDTDPDGDTLNVTSVLIDSDGDGNIDNNLTLDTQTVVYGVNSSGIVVPAGEITVATDGTYTFDPAPGFVGDVAANYTAQDPSGLSDTAVLSIEVTPADQNNTFASDDISTGLQGEILSGNVLNNDSDPELDLQSVQTITDSQSNTLIIDGTTANNLPSGGELIMDSNGDYTYAPASNFVGTEVVTYQVCDDSTLQACDTATLYLVSNAITPQLSLIKEAVSVNYSNSVQIGDQIEYQLDIENTGNVLVTDIILTDQKLGGNITSNCIFPTNTGTVLYPGESATCLGTYTINQTDINNGYVENTASVDGLDSIGQAISDTSDAGDELVETPDALGNTNGDAADDPTTTSIPQSPAIRLEKTAIFNDENADGVSQPGETITYNFLVENIGNVDLSTVEIDDPYITVDGNPLSLLPAGSTDNTTFSGTYTITQSNIEDRAYTNTATVSGVSPLSIIVSDTSDDPTDLTGEDDPTITTLIPNTTNAQNDSNQIPANTVVTGNVLTNDFDLNSDVQILTEAYVLDELGGLVIVLPNGVASDVYDTSGLLAGQIAFDANGLYIFTPALDYNGQVDIQYQLTDDNDTPVTDTASLTIKVLPKSDPVVNQPPLANNDTNTINGQISLVDNVLNNDYDPENSILTVIEVSADTDGDGLINNVITIGSTTTMYGEDEFGNNVIAGMIEISADGVYTLDVEPGFLGDIELNYTIADSDGLTDSATLEIDVVSLPYNSTIANDDIKIGVSGENMTGNVLQNDHDMEAHNQLVSSYTDTANNPLVMDGVTENDLPGGGKVVLHSNGSYTYVPSAAYAGTERIEYQVCDDGVPQACDRATLYLTNQSANVARVDMSKTIYKGHDGGGSCGVDSVEELIIVDPVKSLQNVTFCFQVDNSGDTYIGQLEIDDPLLGITIADMIVVTGNSPLAPGESAVYAYETATDTSIENRAEVTAYVTDQNGDLLDYNCDLVRLNLENSGNCPISSSDEALLIYVFDPPFGVKTGTYEGNSILRWNMVWINSSDYLAQGVVITDEIPQDSTYNGNLTCEVDGISVVNSCQYESPSTLYPRGRVIVDADLGPDAGGTNQADSENELVISFDVVVSNTTSGAVYENQALLEWDADNNGSIDIQGFSQDPFLSEQDQISRVVIPQVGLLRTGGQILAQQIVTFYSFIIFLSGIVAISGVVYLKKK